MTLSLNRRGTAELFELSRVARLVQSFEADSSRSVPNIWQKRLGPSAAPDRWARHGRGLWWLIWLDDRAPFWLFRPLRIRLPWICCSLTHYIEAVWINSNRFSQGAFGLGAELLAGVDQRYSRSVAPVRSGLDQWSPFSCLGERAPWLFACALQGDRLMAEGPVAFSPFASMQAGHAQVQTYSVGFDPASADL